MACGCCGLWRLSVLALALGLALPLLAWALYPYTCCELVNTVPAPDHKPNCGNSEVAKMDKAGYVMLRDFISPEQVAELLAVVEAKAFQRQEYHMGIREIRYPELRAQLPWLGEALRGLRMRLEVETPFDLVYHEHLITPHNYARFFTFNTDNPGTDWHQDIGRWMEDRGWGITGELFLEKTVPSEAGVEFIPWETMDNLDPKLTEIFKKGPVDFLDDAFISLSDDRWYRTTSDMLNQPGIVCSPDLYPGDMILWKNAMLHRSQGLHNKSRVGNRTALYFQIDPQRAPGSYFGFGCYLYSFVNGVRGPPGRLWHWSYMNTRKEIEQWLRPYGRELWIWQQSGLPYFLMNAFVGPCAYAIWVGGLWVKSLLFYVRFSESVMYLFGDTWRPSDHGYCSPWKFNDDI